ncbi:MAG TPA: archaemetzincin family Zn-dependent metalloprotease [Thermoanaerobaculia bacterium]
MNRIRLVPVGDPERRLIEDVRRAVGAAMQVDCVLDSRRVDPAFAFHEARTQYHSTQLVGALAGAPAGELALGIASVDLYIPILTFVFGEAAVGGDAAIVSYHRLRQEFYGLPPDSGLLRERLIKEAIHETGHVLGLTHCEDYECVMAPSHAIEWLDLKSAAFCPECATQVPVPA